MIIKDGEYADIPTPTGRMRLHLFRPAAAGRYPGILLYSEKGYRICFRRRQLRP